VESKVTQLADLVDLRTALANDGTDHIVGNEYLSCKRLPRHRTNRCVRGSAVRNRSARSAEFSQPRHAVECYGSLMPREVGSDSVVV
jgi:hypothetical protein